MTHVIEFEVPVKTVSEANMRGHWATRARRAKTHRSAALVAARAAGITPATMQLWPLIITLSRIAPRELDDDNLRGSAKGVRDGIADALGIDDRDKRVAWNYEQIKSRNKYYSVLVGVHWNEEGIDDGIA